MREQTLNLDKYLSNGLRSSDADSINSPYLTALKGARVKDNGIRPVFSPKGIATKQPNLISTISSGTAPSDSWAFSAGTVSLSGSNVAFASASGGATATCTLSAAKGLDQGETYQVSVTASAHSSGAITMTLGGTAGSVPLNSATTITQNIACGTSNFNFVLTTVGSTTATISSIVVCRLESTISLDIYPYPLLFIGQSDTVSVFESRLYTDNSAVDTNLNAGIDCTTGLNQTHVYNAHNISNISSFEYQVTNPPDFVDLKRSWYLFSNQGVMFKTNWASMNDERQDKVLFSTNPKVNTGTYHKGRIIIGGFNPASVWSSDWSALWDRWKDMLPENVVLTDENFDYNYILWSGIGEGLLWLIYPQIATFGLMNDRKKYSVDYPYFFELIRKNDIGWLPIPARSYVRKIRPLEDHVIVYADDSILALTPMLEPAPGYRIKTIAEFGVHQSFGIGVGDAEHLFVDSVGRLWKIDKELNLDFLDYQEFISGSDMIGSAQDYNFITYNALEKEYYIGDKDKGYVLTEKGLSENLYTFISTYYTGAAALNSKSHCKALYIDRSSTQGFDLETEIFDMGIRSIKQITSVNLGVTATSTDTVSVRIGTRYSGTGSFSYSAWKTVNKEGFVYMLVSGVDFKLCVKSEDNKWGTFKLSNVSVNWQLSDKRNVRGQYAS